MSVGLTGGAQRWGFCFLGFGNKTSVKKGFEGLGSLCCAHVAGAADNKTQQESGPLPARCAMPCRAVLCCAVWSLPRHCSCCCVYAPCCRADCSSHPLLLTEPALAPTGVRSQLAQLVFEAYGLPAVNMVAAAPAAFYHHYSAHRQQQQLWGQQQAMWQGLGAGGGAGLELGLCGSSSGLVVCSGHSATYVVPVYKVRAVALLERGGGGRWGCVAVVGFQSAAVCFQTCQAVLRT